MAQSPAGRQPFVHGSQVGHECSGPTGGDGLRTARRSPSALIARAKQAGVPIYVATGIRDDIVPPQHSISAFNDLADPADRVGDDVLPKLLSQKATRRVSATSADDLYTRAGAPSYLTRTSGSATLVLFEGGHDVVFEAGLAWLRDKRKLAPKAP